MLHGQQWTRFEWVHEFFYSRHIDTRKQTYQDVRSSIAEHAATFYWMRKVARHLRRWFLSATTL